MQARRAKPEPLAIDCANGVGFFAAQTLAKYLGDALPLKLYNTATDTLGALNNACGADYVKTTQKMPPSMIPVLQRGQRACSLDGDADRLIYYYVDERGIFHMLDGDKIAALVAAFIVDLVNTAGLNGKLEVGVVQTAYANGASTKYLASVRCSFTSMLKCSIDQDYRGYPSPAYPPVLSTFITRQSTSMSGFILKLMVMGRFSSHLQP